ncbi:hypothetical protein NPIL_6251 [Nephila pilipes]|uniref:Uncharacterized protein n=1 Tax=Nephila pilipes TaxID=299642 RepID=A0A8X6QRK9_NEPPI|nr:hypothetical protein NPIL_6251 [Nephila pilipes]
MLSMSDTAAIPTDSMDTDQTEIDTIQTKRDRISLLKKKLECDEARQTYLKNLIIIEEREKNFSQQPLWTALDTERKTLEAEMKNIAGELRSFFVQFPNLLEVTYRMSQTNDDFEKLDIFYKGMCPSSSG